MIEHHTMLPNEYEYIPACGGSATITAGRGGVKQGETAVLGVINGVNLFNTMLLA